MRYTVYVWVGSDSVGAEVVKEVSAGSVDAAIENVMSAHNLPYAVYVWVVPTDGRRQCVDRYGVWCSSAQVNT